jgi:hypothetical protein
MAKSSNASSSSFGLEFQSNAAIVLMIKNIEKASKIRVEGLKQDIEITLNDGKIIYSQAKSVFNTEDYSNVLTKLQEALESLNNVAKDRNVDTLIYVTNTPNPFRNIQTMNAFVGSITILNYDELNSICKNKIEEICNRNNYEFNRHFLSVCVLQFQGDGENRYKVIKDIINEFLYKIEVGDRGFGQKMLEIWQREFSINSSQKKISTTISKQQMIWPLIVLLCEIDREDALLVGLDDAEFEEIKNKYKTVISNNTERFTFISKVMTTYHEYKVRSTSTNKEKLFIEKHWHDYKDEFNIPTASPEIMEAVIKLSIANVLKHRYRISDIQKAVNI